MYRVSSPRGGRAKESAFDMLPVNVCFLTLVLAVQRVHSPQPHQAHEQDDRPHDLHEETHLVEGRYDDSQGLSLRGDSASQQEGFCGIRPYVVIGSADSFFLFVFSVYYLYLQKD